ncbi:MAG: F0F1 ATP synthase subunit A [Prevotellaceae bacterium]|jgi:F-type H+-transporting ATPase subunit a|nr:F0F1 ATP synthase subunit A [Prevotellaceae bacterium]
MLNNKVYIIVLYLLFVFAGLPKAFGDEQTHKGKESGEELIEDVESIFNVKGFTFSHILDSYSFHITNIGKTIISVPLPVIVKSKDRGWFVFMSSKFHHGETGYKGFSIAKEGEPYAYKVVETLPDGSVVRSLDFSITKVAFSLMFTVVLLCCVFIPIARKYTKNPLKVPSGLQSLLEPLVLFVLNDVIKSALGDSYKKYAPYLLTVFFFILTLNLSGLIPVFPFGANITGSIVIPGLLAFFTYIIINVSSTKGYWREMLWPPGVPLWLKFPIPVMPLIEFLSSITKPLVLMMRLFANMMAGHLLTIVMMSLIFIFGAMSAIIADTVTIVSILITIFMTILHILVAVIQAYVFTLLSSVFISAARVKDEHYSKKEITEKIKV